MGGAATLFYLCFHSSYYNFDGVACAIAVELGDWAHLVHGNHLAYGIVGLLFDRLWRVLGYEGQAILSLQILDSFLGGLGVGLLCSLLLRLRFPRAIALGCAAGLGFSQAYWFWSLEAQVYLLGTVFIILAAGEALSDKPRPVRLGFWHALAILGHVGHAMFLPVAIYRLWKTRPSRWELAKYASSLALTVLSSYAAAAVFCVRAATPRGWGLWLLGSAALTRDRSFYWYGNYSLMSLFKWLQTTGRIMVDPLAGAGLNFGFGLALAMLPLAAASWAGWKHRRGSRAGAVKACLLWIASYAALFVSWQPVVEVYHIPDLVPLWILTAATLEALPARTAAAALAAWLAGAGFYNAAETIFPRGDALANAPYQESLWLSKKTPADSWIVVTAREQVYVPYFAHRKPLNMRYFPVDDSVDSSAKLYARLDEIAASGEPVFVTKQTMEADGWTRLFEDYGIVLESTEEGRVLYRLKRRGSLKAAGRKS